MTTKATHSVRRRLLRAAGGCAALATAALAIDADPALAHVTVAPQFVPAQDSSTLRVTVPNEREEGDITNFSLRVPAGMSVQEVSRTLGWQTRVDGRTISFSGGRVPPKDEASFAIGVSGPARAGSVTLDATLAYPDGSEVRWPVNLAVLPGSGGGQNIPAAAIVAVVGLVAIGSLLALQWTRRTPRAAGAEKAPAAKPQRRPRRRHGRPR